MRVRNFAVLGGGVSGLSAALYLRHAAAATGADIRVDLFEADGRFGGWVRSEVSPAGHLWERGPRTLRPRGVAGENTLRVLSALGLQGAVVPVARGSAAARVRLVFAQGALHELPSSALGLLRTCPPFSRPLAAALLRDLTAPRSPLPLPDESIYDFAARRFGQEIADFAVSPLVCGVCAGDAREISVNLLMKPLFEAEQRHGSVLKGLLKEWLWSWIKPRGSWGGVAGKEDPLVLRARRERWSVYSLRGGLEVLPRALAAAAGAAGARLHLQAPVDQLAFLPGGGATVRVGGEEHRFDHVLSALPAHALAAALGATQQHPALASDLRAVPFASVAVVALQFRGRVLRRDAFGFLVPPAERLPLLGVVFDSCCFPDARGDTLLTAMLGGRWFRERLGDAPSHDELCHLAQRHAAAVLDLPAPERASAKVLRHCIPQYVVGHEQRVRRVRAYLAERRLPLSLCGASFDGVGLNDAILSAKGAVDALAFV